MRKIIFLAAALIPLAAIAAEQKVTARQTMTTAAYSFDCVVQGSPVEFPDDIYVKNTGNVTVFKGTIVHWSIPNTGREGDYVLTEDLAPGKSMFFSGVVGGGLSAGTKCGVIVKPKAEVQLRTTSAVTIAKMKLVPSVSCKVQGTPVEFPDDIYILNDGAAMVPKGTTIHWSIATSNMQGDYTLLADLERGKGVFISGALPGGHGAGPCTASIINK
jgi:hypothetical protein